MAIKPLGDIPRGIEVLVKKAAVDAAFREALLRERAAAAGRIGLALEPAEQAMLAAIPVRQLEQVIAGTRVPAPLRAAFMGYAAAAMLTVIGTSTGCSEKDERTSTERESQSPPAKGGTGVSGIVHDHSGKPIAGALIYDETSGASTITNGNGRFLLLFANQESVKLRVTGFNYDTRYLPVISLKPSETKNLDVILSETPPTPITTMGIRPETGPNTRVEKNPKTKKNYEEQR